MIPAPRECLVAMSMLALSLEDGARHTFTNTGQVAATIAAVSAGSATRTGPPR